MVEVVVRVDVEEMEGKSAAQSLGEHCNFELRDLARGPLHRTLGGTSDDGAADTAR